MRVGQVKILKCILVSEVRLKKNLSERKGQLLVRVQRESTPKPVPPTACAGLQRSLHRPGGWIGAGSRDLKNNPFRASYSFLLFSVPTLIGEQAGRGTKILRETLYFGQKTEKRGPWELLGMRHRGQTWRQGIPNAVCEPPQTWAQPGVACAGTGQFVTLEATN